LNQRYEESVENYEKAISILEKSLGAKHASVASTIQFIANVHLANEKFEFLNYRYFHKTIIIFIEFLQNIFGFIYFIVWTLFGVKIMHHIILTK
jgi:hypothetical protein